MNGLESTLCMRFCSKLPLLLATESTDVDWTEAKFRFKISAQRCMHNHSTFLFLNWKKTAILRCVTEGHHDDKPDDNSNNTRCP